MEVAQWVSGTVLGPDDRPRTGLRVVGLSDPVLKTDRFKVRGININHSELEDLLFFNQGITDFKAEVSNAESGLDVLRLFIEPRQGVDVGALRQRILLPQPRPVPRHRPPRFRLQRRPRPDPPHSRPH